MNERICRSAEPRLLGTPSKEGEERRRLVLERKAQHDLEKHEKLLQKLGQVEDRRQAVMEERRRKALESANRLNERIALANAKRRQQEEQNRMKKESAIKKTEESSERAAVIKRSNTIPRSFSMHVAANKQSPSTQNGGDSKPTQPTIKIAHVPRRIMKSGQTSAHDTSGSDSDSGRLMRSKSARFAASSVALGAPKAASTPLRHEMNKPMLSGKTTITRSRSTRVISNRKSSPDTNSTSENSSVRNSVENKVKFSAITKQDNKANPSGSSAAAVRRSQSNPTRRGEPRKAIEAKPMSPLVSHAKKPSASTSKLVPDVKAKAPQKPQPETQPTEAQQQPLPEKKFDAAEEEFKKKLAEKRRLARERQNQKSEKQFGLTTVVSMPNVATTSDVASEKDNTTDESFSMEDTIAANDVTKMDPVVEQKPEPEAISESEREKEARKQREREEAVALRMKKMEEEREQARLKEAEENAKLESEERERERLLKEAELERQRKQEEEERAARKAKLEAIMARTRAGGGASVTRALATSVLETHKRKEEERVTDSDVSSVSKPTCEQNLDSAGDLINNNTEPSSVEHDSPTGSKVPSPGIDSLSPVGVRHIVSHGIESSAISTSTVGTTDSNFEQVIVLPSEERGPLCDSLGPEANDVVPPQSVESVDPSCESDERDMIISKASDENNESPVPNFSNPVSHDNDNAEHMQFHF